MTTTRRRMLGAAAAAGLLPGWLQALHARGADPASADGPAPPAGPDADGPHGRLGPPDEHGVRLPPGFQARLLATSGQPVAGSGYPWHPSPDGGATFPLDDGGWVYVSNSEVDDRRGGVGALRFDRDGAVVDAYPLLTGTSHNCAGGPTPWGTWLSCEEVPDGRVWECRPEAAGQGVVRPALGRFRHEAAAVDPVTGHVYLTEDERDGRLYRFVPARAGVLDDGRLEAAAVGADGRVHWHPASADGPERSSRTTAFARAEGAWLADGRLIVCTTLDHRVWSLDLATQRLSVLHERSGALADSPLRHPDNVTVHPASRGLVVCEDGDDRQCVWLAPRGDGWGAWPLVQLDGHGGSELAGAAFSPDGTRLYVSSQRGLDRVGRRRGMTFEIRGPFGG